MKTEYEIGLEIGQRTAEGLRLLRFICESDYRALLRFSATSFDAYEPDPQKNWERGQVVFNPDDVVSKFLFTGDGRLNEQPRIVRQDGELRVVPNIVRLHRNVHGRHRRVRDEFCETGMWRWWDDDPNREAQHGWYRVREGNDGRILTVSDSTPPPNNTSVWEYMGKENPPD